MSRGIVVFSGGSAANSLVDVFNSVRDSKNCPLSYIIPISDNGGSSSELIRVFGGPGIGDVRSRLVRLIPTHPRSTERTAIANLFNHRLSSSSSHAASVEWQALVSGTSPLWSLIPSSKKQLIRSFFNLLNLEILKRSRPPTSTFDFTSASVGNLFLTGARLFSGSFESAIYLLGSICGVPDDIVRVIPAINSNFTHHIAAGLADGSVIVGQNSISHPSEHTALEAPSSPLSPGSKKRRSRLSLGDPEAIPTDDELAAATLDSDHELKYGGEADPEHEDANLPGSLATLRKPNIKFSKSYSHNSSSPTNDDLPSRIERVWYINPYGQEISPPPNPRVCEAIRSAQAIIYSIGSLYTSIIPSIVLRGVGEAIRQSPATRTKILILNGSLDREVGPRREPFTALDFVEAIVRAGEESRGVSWRGVSPQREAVPPTGEAAPAAPTVNGTASAPTPPKPHPPSIHATYITHLIHLSGASEMVPHVDASRLRALGIHTVKLYGRKIEETSADGAETLVKGMKYDPEALKGALDTILGRRGMGVLDNAAAGDEVALELGPVGRGLMTRRNTLEA
ncbi:hypothetical protein EPUS_02725 [Endocarpon pusillum Z07020]|uniref:Uncharacterized protein n=1 Tax=Endocarpon pusillum (strain Z07020 / HMAS-L-300199) TaxID=1263415 RepID=U1HHE5_ENDPU|nr:uncharacterized protein EPUS_02725 [Endocarpon pusillum Z07020]ERF68269.1 hypothetical protein EPUS_02725 [Endocarpon pusillum Z07020]